MNNQVIWNLLEKQIQKSPNYIAVQDEQCALTNKEFAQLINTIEQNIPADAKMVGVVMDHTVEMIAAIFAILKHGAAYVPAEPSFPVERIHFMMRDSNVQYVIANSAYTKQLEGFTVIEVDQRPSAYFSSSECCSTNTYCSTNERHTTSARSNASTRHTTSEHFGADECSTPASKTSSTCQATPLSLAYVLYTSGSTGTPKGVSVSNQNVCHYAQAFQHEFCLTPQDAMLQYSVCTFDIFVEEVFATLLNGARLVIPCTKTKSDLGRLMEFVERHNVTVISGFPYLLLDMNRLDCIPKSLRLLISGGDILRESYITNLVDTVEIYNTYGPSETTVCASYFRCNDQPALANGVFPIGKAVYGSELLICDENLNLVSPGEIGEICIKGGGVSLGYFGNRATENKAFVTLENGERLYRSGDMGYQLADGNVVFLNRKDNQVMIRGKRVEPVEIEGVLCNCEEIEKAAVKHYTDEQNQSYLVAYVVSADRSVSLSSLKKKLSRYLTAYMIPEFFVQMPDLPLNANGKVDASALPIIMKEGFAA